jgi:hypothetical protein
MKEKFSLEAKWNEGEFRKLKYRESKFKHKFNLVFTSGTRADAKNIPEIPDSNQI